MIGIVLKGLSQLKIMHPICVELANAQQKYILYYNKGSKTRFHNAATLNNINKFSSVVTKNAQKCVRFDNLNELESHLKNHRITKLVGIELYNMAKTHIKIFRQMGIGLYSISYLIDSFWSKNSKCVTALDRVYYTTKYTMEKLHHFLNIRENPDRDKLLGSPLLPYPTEKQNRGKKVLILLPNLKREYYDVAFASGMGMSVGIKCYRSSIEILSRSHDLIIKTRPKQWMDGYLKKFVDQVISDKYKMYPPPTWKSLEQTHSTMLYYSSGVFEVVLSGNYALNVPINLKRYKRMGFQPERMVQHFTSRKQSLYNYKGVVESVRLAHINNGSWKLKNKIDLEERKKWIKEFVGPVFKNSAREIVNDIINS